MDLATAAYIVLVYYPADPIIPRVPPTLLPSNVNPILLSSHPQKNLPLSPMFTY